jgi:hypothetical protein
MSMSVCVLEMQVDMAMHGKTLPGQRQKRVHVCIRWSLALAVTYLGHLCRFVHGTWSAGCAGVMLLDLSQLSVTCTWLSSGWCHPYCCRTATLRTT